MLIQVDNVYKHYVQPRTTVEVLRSSVHLAIAAGRWWPLWDRLAPGKVRSCISWGGWIVQRKARYAAVGLIWRASMTVRLGRFRNRRVGFVFPVSSSFARIFCVGKHR